MRKLETLDQLTHKNDKKTKERKINKIFDHMYHNCVKFIDTYTLKHHLLDSSLADQQNNERHYLDNIVLCVVIVRGGRK